MILDLPHSRRPNGSELSQRHWPKKEVSVPARFTPRPSPQGGPAGKRTALSSNLAKPVETIVNRYLIRIFFAAAVTSGLPTSDVYADHHATQNLSALDMMNISRSGSFELDMTPGEALPLFTAQGEKLWVPDWRPEILSGDGFEKGTVFVTSSHGHKTNWIVMDYDTETLHALYARVTPEIDAGTVEVTIVPNGRGGSIVNVTYQLTALSATGAEKLQASFSENNYARMMEDWRSMISSNVLVRDRRGHTDQPAESG